MKKVDFVLIERKLRYRDETRLSPLVRAKLARRRETGAPEPEIVAYHFRKDSDPTQTSTAGTLVSAFLFGVGITLVAGWVFNSVVAAIVGTICILLFGAMVYSEFTTTELDCLSEDDLVELADKAVKIQLTPIETRRPLRIGNSQKTSRQSTIEWIAGSPTGIERIDTLLSHALDLSEEIPQRASWSSAYLERHRLQLDPITEARHIIEHGLAIRVATDHLGKAPTGTSDTAVAAKRAFELAQRPLDIVWDRLIQRVEALDDYVQGLRELDAELANAESAARAFELDEQFGELLTNAVGDEFAAKHLRHLSDDVHGLSSAMNDMINALNGDLNTLVALRATSV